MSTYQFSFHLGYVDVQWWKASKTHVKPIPPPLILGFESRKQQQCCPVSWVPQTALCQHPWLWKMVEVLFPGLPSLEARWGLAWASLRAFSGGWLKWCLPERWIPPLCQVRGSVELSEAQVVECSVSHALPNPSVNLQPCIDNVNLMLPLSISLLMCSSGQFWPYKGESCRKWPVIWLFGTKLCKEFIKGLGLLTWCIGWWVIELLSRIAREESPAPTNYLPSQQATYAPLFSLGWPNVTDPKI